MRLAEKIHRAAMVWPDQVAVWADGRTQTYAEMDRDIRQTASALLKAAPDKGRVGIFARRSFVSSVGILACAATGKPFVPLNPSFPAHRTREMIEAAQLDAIIVDSGVEPSFLEVAQTLRSKPALLFPGHQRLATAVPLADFAMLDQVDIARLDPLVQPVPHEQNDIAYILFTSGSTGKSKGVPISYGALEHLLACVDRRYGIEARDRFIQTFDETFDLSLLPLFSSWLNGATLYCTGPLTQFAMADFINEHGITIWFSVPSLASLIDWFSPLKATRLPSLRWSLFCGEELPEDLARNWQMAAANSVLENVYGPTELTLFCTAHRFDMNQPNSEAAGLVPIGKPLPGLQSLLIDEGSHLVPHGEAGELCVSGPQLFVGYWRNDELTREKTFVHEGEIYYRTGDLAKISQEGNLLFLGRRDLQVKINGFRVELHEVEAVLRGSEMVRQAVAFGNKLTGSVHEHVVAIVTGDALDQSRLIQHAAERLPAYMVPKDIRVVEQMPLNVNGKIDRKRLTEQFEGPSERERPTQL